MLLCDRDMNVVSANPAAHRILGIGDEATLRLTGAPEEWTIVDEHGRALPVAQLPASLALATGRIIRSTTIGMYHRPRGRMIWISTTNVPVFSPGQSTPDFVFGLFSDITELKRDNALFDRAQSLAHIGGWEWDRSQSRLYLTGEARRILGQHHPMECMEDLMQCLGRDDELRLQQALQEAIEHRACFELEMQGHRSDGHAFWVRMIGEVEAGDLASTRIAGTLQDITDRKQAEETLRIQARTDPLTGIMNRDAVLGDLATRLANPTHAQVAVLYIDLHLIHEVTSPQAFTELRTRGLAPHRPDRTKGTMDHSTPTLPADADGRLPYSTEAARAQVETLAANCTEFGIELFDMASDERGIVHVIAPEQGFTLPGMTIVCGDSHTSTHGAFGALAFGIGTSEVEHVMATQTLSLKPFKTMAIEVTGEFHCFAFQVGADTNGEGINPERAPACWHEIRRTGRFSGPGGRPSSAKLR